MSILKCTKVSLFSKIILGYDKQKSVQNVHKFSQMETYTNVCCKGI